MVSKVFIQLTTKYTGTINGILEGNFILYTENPLDERKIIETLQDFHFISKSPNIKRNIFNNKIFYTIVDNVQTGSCSKKYKIDLYIQFNWDTSFYKGKLFGDIYIYHLLQSNDINRIISEKIKLYANKHNIKYVSCVDKTYTFTIYSFRKLNNIQKASLSFFYHFLRSMLKTIWFNKWMKLFSFLKFIRI